jgi:hypothetical protein
MKRIVIAILIALALALGAGATAYAGDGGAHIDCEKDYCWGEGQL